MTAVIYKWGPDRVLKLFYNQFDDESIKLEFRIGNAVHEAGVSSPDVFEIVEVNNRKGIVLERIYGKTLLKHSLEKPWNLSYYAREMARFHYKIHKYSTDRLPSQMERFSMDIRKSSKILGDKEKKILDYIGNLPDGNSICHGDFHFLNIIMSDKGPVAIDWISGYTGNPLGDVARTCMILSLPPKSPIISNMMKILPDYYRKLIYRTYLDEYMMLAKVKYKDIDEWMLPVAAACLKDGLWDQKCLIDIIDRCLKKYNV